MAASDSERIMLSQKKLALLQGQVRSTTRFRVVPAESIHAGQNWDLFTFPRPGYVSDARIGPCLVHGQGLLPTNNDRVLIQPITINHASSPSGTVSLGRDRWYSVPKDTFDEEHTIMLTYIFFLRAIIKDVDIPRGEVNVGKIIVTMYEILHNEGQPDRSRELMLTLDELQKEVANGNVAYKVALDVFAQSNIDLAKRILPNTSHEVSAGADQLIIGAPIRREPLDQWSLAPKFLRAHLRSGHK